MIYDIEKNIALSASAGSGKTYAIVGRFLKLLYYGIDPNKILCVTFTNKAAKEMRDRLLDAVYGFSNFNTLNEHKKSELLELKGNIGIYEPIESVHDKFKEIGSKLYSNSINIKTIDAFFYWVLKLFAIDADLSLDFNIAYAKQYDDILSKVIDIVSDEILNNSNKKLNFFDMLYQLNEKNPLFFFKEKLLPLINIRPEFENLRKNLPFNNISLIEKQCLNAKNNLCYFLLLNENKINKVSRSKMKNFCSCDSIDKYAYIFDKDITQLSTYKKLKSKVFFDLWEQYKLYVCKFFEYKTHFETQVILDFLSEFFKVYDDILLNNNFLSFSDIKYKVYDLFFGKNNLSNNRDYFYFRLDMRIKHLLIDEFQDTDIIQWKIIKPIVEEITSGLSTGDEGGSLFYVGDPKQSIYRFRGAQSVLFERPKMDFLGKIDEYSLDKNYRSKKEIVDFTNKVFSHKLIENLGWKYNAICSNTSGNGYVFVDSNDNFKDQEVLNTAIKRSIDILIDKGFNYRDIVILVRTNKVVDHISSYLTSVGIEHITETSLMLINSDIGVILMSILNFFSSRNPIFKEQFTSYIDIKTSEQAIKNISKAINIKDNFSVFIDIIKVFKLDLYFKTDENLYSIIDVAHKASLESSNFMDFITSFERGLGITKRSSLDNTNNGVRVMTVHQAKGLEFECVILPDVSFNINLKVNEFIYVRNDDLRLIDFLRQPNKTKRFYSNKLDLYYENEKKLNVFDEINNLYVAITRAKTALFILGYGNDNMFHFIEKALNIKNNQYIIGTLENHYVSYKISAPCKSPFLSSVNLRRLPESSRDDKDSRKGIFGEAFHYAMEIIDDFYNVNQDHLYNNLKHAYSLYLEDSIIKDITERVERLVSNRTFLNMIDGRIYKEKAFIKNNELLRVDVMVEKKECLYVLDYKTHLNKRFEKQHRDQVKNYVNVVKEIYKKPTYGYLIYVDKSIEFMEVKE